MIDDLPKGFKAGAAAASFKKAGRDDLGLIVSDRPCVLAGMFTQNLFKAAPVLVCQEILGTCGTARAVLANSGQANACTGEEGLNNCRATQKMVAEAAGLTPRETVEGYRHLASVQFSQRRFEAGEETLQQCLALPLRDHDKMMCMYDLADQNMARERWQEVADLCQQILDSGPDKELRGLSGYLLGDALEQLGKGAEALKQFELARDEYPNPSVMDNRIAHLRNKLKKQAK